ncbi:hypothetical protein MF672_030495 [Actinomadura sp. ATCC 31491]|uniref:Uncharacterized protein n=1 Tax=Actinomadura luzonensis TaxID=2805427 RepID=A0ABT0G113_9ACTN|nr:hypothetical protein [Actinomadura luzonensis]MCK2218088.1 hypothetical protein [Actinomadura luzonensis]
MMYGPPPPPGYPPEYPRATSSPPIIVLVAGLAALLGFLLGVFVGYGATGTDDATGADGDPEPQLTVTVEDTGPPPDDPQATTSAPAATPPSDTPPAPDATPPGATAPGATAPGATQPAGINPASLRTLVVGKDIQPGTYRTAGPTAGFSMCFWARMRNVSAAPADVITSGMPTGPATVTIEPADKAFATGGCAEWTRS